MTGRMEGSGEKGDGEEKTGRMREKESNSVEEG